jgi:hypothetical protein
MPGAVPKPDELKRLPPFSWFSDNQFARALRAVRAICMLRKVIHRARL